jgi:hypothetical protein
MRSPPVQLQLNPRWLWGVNAFFAFGYEKIKLQRGIGYEIPK